MTDIYFEVPVSTHETKVCISQGDDVWIFKIIFFESELSDTCIVTVIGDCKEDSMNEVQTLSSRMDSCHNNEFKFVFETTDNMKIIIRIYEDGKSFRNINVMY